MIVLDASAAVELFLGTSLGQAVARRIADPAETLHGPHLLDLEVVQAFRHCTRTGRLTERRAAQALDDLLGLRLVRYPHEMLVERIWELRANVSAYDATYLALAEMLAAPLLTTDARLSRVPGTTAAIELL
jgi:predicted nucleic acid-binding protein